MVTARSERTNFVFRPFDSMKESCFECGAARNASMVLHEAGAPYYTRVMGWTVTFKTNGNLLTSQLLLHTPHLLFCNIGTLVPSWKCPWIFAVGLSLSYKLKKKLTACAMPMCFCAHLNTLHWTQWSELEMACTTFKGYLNKQTIKEAQRWTRWVLSLISVYCECFSVITQNNIKAT